MDSVFLLSHRGLDGIVTSLGFLPTESAAEAHIKVAKWQPAYRGSQDGFIVDTYLLDRQFSFKNDSSEPLILVIEPWGTSEIIAPGSIVDIFYPIPANQEDTSHADQEGDTLLFWCEGPTFEVDIDGARIAT
jgi:hypothetical protein